MLVISGLGAMISDLNRLCYHHYIHVLDLILQVIVTYYMHVMIRQPESDNSRDHSR